MTYAAAPVKRTLERIKAILEADMPAHVATAGLKTIESWTYAQVVVDEENQLPQGVIDLKWRRRPISIGGGILPHYDLDLIFALEWIGNQDNYVAGAEMAAIAEAVMFDHAQAEDGTGTLWTSIINSTVVGAPVGDEVGEWQGGHVQMRLEGAQINY